MLRCAERNDLWFKRLDEWCFKLRLLRGEEMSDQFSNHSQEKTMKYRADKDKNQQAKEILTQVHQALEAKGYHPIKQLVGYFMSGDPTFITSHENAREKIRRLERDELIEELLRNYLNDFS